MEQHTQNEEQNVQTNEVPPVKNVSEQTPSPQSENSIKEIFKFALIALIIVVPIRLYIAQPFIVQGGSMEHTFQTGEYLIVDQLSYRFEEPQRGEVIIFRFPGDTSKFYIKFVDKIWSSLRKILYPEVVFDDEGSHHFLSSREVTLTFKKFGFFLKKSSLFFGLLQYLVISKYETH